MLHHNPQINPIHKTGTKDAAVLLIHGFTGTPDSLRPLANHLNSLGFTVCAPLLAGHGSTKEALEKTGWKDWYATCRQEFLQLQKNYPKVYVAGLSLGGVLALKLAEDYPQGLNAVASLAAPIFLKSWIHAVVPLVTYSPLKYFYKYQKKAQPDVKDPNAKKNYWNTNEMPIRCINSLIQLQRTTRRQLAKIVAPALLIHSRYDSTAPYESMNYIAQHISANITETVTLENSFHLISIDYEKDKVNQKVSEFFMRFM